MKADKKKKLVYIISGVQKSLSFEWVSVLLKNDYSLTFILLNPGDSELERFLKNENINCIRITYCGKRDIAGAFFKITKYFILKRPNIIHAHLFEAQLIALTSAWLAGVKNRVYTRHNSNYHQRYFPGAVKYDKWSNRLATTIISISQATDKTLIDLEHVPISKIVKIPHGFKFDDFLNVDLVRINIVKKKWAIPEGRQIIGVIARQIEWKGIQYIIPAFKKYLTRNPDACLVMANAHGPYHEEVLALLKHIPQESYILIPFEDDVSALYKTFDFYIHTPIDGICEAFGQTYIEALASGIPSIFTPSGIAAEFIEDKQNACLANFEDAESIYKNLVYLSDTPLLVNEITTRGRADVINNFGVNKMHQKLMEVYNYE